MKKILSQRTLWISTVAIMLLLFLGAQASATPAAEKAPAEKLSFSYIRPVWGPATYVKGGAYEQALFAKANINVDVQIIPVMEYDTKIRTIVASGTLPDLLWAYGPGDSFWRDLENQGAFARVDQRLESYPTIKGTVSDTVWGHMQNPKDDATYFIPRTIASVVPFFTYYRADWFEKLGIDEPKTIDELTAALTKVKQGYPDVFPMTNGMGFFIWMFKDLGTSFGDAVGGWIASPDTPGTIVPSFTTAQERNYLFWLQDLRRRGLMDPEVGVNPDPNHGKQKFMSGRAAAYPGGYPDYIEITSSLMKTDPNARVGVMSPLTGPTGIQGGTRTVYPVDRGLYFSSKSTKVDAILHFMEWYLTDGSEFRVWGVEGEMYNVVDGQKVPVPESERKDAYKSPQIEPLTFLNLPEEQLDWSMWRRSFESSGIGDQFDQWKAKFDEYASVRYPDYLSPTVVSPTNVKSGAQIWEDTMASTWGSVGLDTSITPKNYTDAVADWLTNGGSDIIKEVNQQQSDKSKPDF